MGQGDFGQGEDYETQPAMVMTETSFQLYGFHAASAA